MVVSCELCPLCPSHLDLELAAQSCRNQVAPLMTPEPTCPLCHEQFLEQIEESAGALLFH